MLTALSVLVALVIDWCIGWPAPVFRRIGHPVTWIGHLISVLDRRLNRPELPRRGLGAVVVIGLVLSGFGMAWLIESLLPRGLVGAVVAGVLMWPLVAARSMRDHFVAVREPLAAGDLATASTEVAKIVGRDPQMLDDAAVARAAIESLAENTSDGVIAPVFWAVLLGLPGIVAYKTINTLDSMIGHKTERHLAFGWAAARTDDVANLVPARVTATLFAGVGWSRQALTVMWRDARLHRSPNAGWPEAAMAGALGVRLSGPRGYTGIWSDEPWVNASAPDPTPADMARATAIYERSMVALAVLLTVIVVI